MADVKEGENPEPERVARPPSVRSDRLHNVVRDTYSWGVMRPVVGDGKAATALAHEFENGAPTGVTRDPRTGQAVGLWHAVDVVDLLNRYRKAIRYGNLDAEDRRVALAEAKELWGVLQRSDAAGAVSEWVREVPARLTTVRNGIRGARRDPDISTVTGAEFEVSPYGERKLRTAAQVQGFAARILGSGTSADRAEGSGISPALTAGIQPMDRLRTGAPDGRENDRRQGLPAPGHEATARQRINPGQGARAERGRGG